MEGFMFAILIGLSLIFVGCTIISLLFPKRFFRQSTERPLKSQNDNKPIVSPNNTKAESSEYVIKDKIKEFNERVLNEGIIFLDIEKISANMSKWYNERKEEEILDNEITTLLNESNLDRPTPEKITEEQKEKYRNDGWVPENELNNREWYDMILINNESWYKLTP